MSARGEASWIVLGRHFFSSFFRLNVLDDAGEESFKRAMIGVVAGILALGLFLGRMYLAKYARLSARPTGADYRLMLPADQLLMICLVMFVVTLVTVLVSHSVFPDESDYRILMPLPVSRRAIFAAKVIALCSFAAIFVVGASVGIGVPFSLVSSGRWVEQTLAWRLLAQIVAGMLASIFAIAGVVAVQGAITVLAPRRGWRTLSTAVQTGMVCSLVLSIPAIARIPILSSYLNTAPPALYFVPPAWFLGVQQWLLGSRQEYFVRLGITAIVGTAVAVAVAASSCLVLYRRFDRVIVPAQSGRPPWSWNIRLRWPFGGHPARDAVQSFLSATLRRSSLHQLVFFAVSVAGTSMAVNSVIGAVGHRESWMIAAVLGAPLTIIAAAVVGLRAALLLPAHLRAAWIFRLTEEAGTRRYQLDAVRHTCLGVTVFTPAVLTFPLHAGVLGLSSALACVPIVVLLGSLFVDVALNGWRRIPFTCTLLLGKRPAALTLFLSVLAFNVFVTVGTSLQQVARTNMLSWLAVAGILSGVSTVLWWYRRQVWGRLPLEFEDSLPGGVETLNL